MRTIDNLETLSDGKRYTIHDKAKVDTGGCNNCSACCHSTSELVVLNPLDVYHIKRLTRQSFDELLDCHFTLLQQGSGIQLPHLKSIGAEEKCSFLNPEMRCGIHSALPDICRLFPLGRVYDGDDYQYFLQRDACIQSTLLEVHVKTWLNIPNYTDYHAFILDWYKLQKALAFRLKFVKEEEERCLIQTYLLDTFYRFSVEDYRDFYTAFNSLLPQAKKNLGII